MNNEGNITNLTGLVASPTQPTPSRQNSCQVPVSFVDTDVNLGLILVPAQPKKGCRKDSEKK